MTKKLPVSTLQNNWHDAQRVDTNDLNVEQTYNNQTNAAVVNNFFGSGVLPENPEQPTLFDSDALTSTQAALVSANNFDGTGIDAHTQPSDNNLGNQLEVELSESTVFGRFSVKVLIVGLSFDNELIYDRFYFYRNEKQVTSKHYKRILTIIFNDFKGNNNCSKENGGRIIVKEASPFELSRDPIMVAQDVEPNIFFRDFKIANQTLGLHNTIQTAIGSEFDVDNLDINVTGKPVRSILADDVTTQIGQKFKAFTNNIQKITLLLGVSRDELAAEENRFDWSGDLIISIYPLQTTVSCPTDIVPELAIDFDPSPTPLVEISFSQATLRDAGYVLTDIAQPVDFVFNSTKIAVPGGITPDNFYAFTFRRSGAATNGTIFSETGNDWVENSRLTIFSGVWVDTNEEDLYFQIWTDAAKVADGQGYDAGNGIRFAKTITDPLTGAEIDNQQGHFSFSSTGQGIVNTSVIQALTEESVSVQDERTGNPIFSRKEYIPSVSFVTNSQLSDLQELYDPLILGSVADNNSKINPTLTKTQNLPGLAKGDTFCIINPDPDLLSLQLIGSKLVPNTGAGQIDYRIYKVQVCTDGYGDVLGDGTIATEDVARATELLGESLLLASTQNKIVSGDISTLELWRADVDGDGYITTNDVDLIQRFVNKEINSFPVGSSFTHMCLFVQQSIGRQDGYFTCTNGEVRLDGYAGQNIVDSSSLDSIELIYDGYLIDPTIDTTDPAFNIVPFVPINYQIKFQPFWQDYLLILDSAARIIPATFTYFESVETKSCTTASTFECEDRIGNIPTTNPGRNDFFVPDNLIIGKGQILNPDGTTYKNDLEIGTIVLNLPETAIIEKSLNIFDVFVAESGIGSGKTSSNFNCLKYSDCSAVQPSDLALGRVKFSVSIQSVMTILDGYSGDDEPDEQLGVYLDYTTGLLTLNIQNLFVDSIYQTLVSKIQINVYLKKAGWNNNILVVSPDEVSGLLI
jgi:hypothetical protein